MKTKLAELGRHNIRGKRIQAKETETEKNRAKYFSQIDRARMQDIDRAQAGTQLEWDEQFCLGEIFSRENDVVKESNTTKNISSTKSSITLPRTTSFSSHHH